MSKTRYSRLECAMAAARAFRCHPEWHPFILIADMGIDDEEELEDMISEGISYRLWMESGRTITGRTLLLDAYFRLGSIEFANALEMSGTC